MGDVRVVVLGGTSHVGKSTVAKAWAECWEARCISTDQMARHPGRPWNTDNTVPEHVFTYYRSLPVHELTAAQWSHYERLWPQVEALITEHAADGRQRLVLEGSGVLPQHVAALRTAGVAALWLTANARTLRDRIHAASQYQQRSVEQQLPVDRFLGRTLGYQQLMLDTVQRLGLAYRDTSSTTAIEDLIERPPFPPS